MTVQELIDQYEINIANCKSWISRYGCYKRHDHEKNELLRDIQIYEKVIRDLNEIDELGNLIKK